MNADLASIIGRDVSRETMARLVGYQGLVEQEAERQNLVSQTTIAEFWNRHIIDSAQLCRLAPEGAHWLDIGSGAGLPGVIIALLTSEPVTLVEPRRLRADFLRRCVSELGLSRVTIAPTKVERVEGAFDVITARAVASLDTIFALAHHLSRPETRWVLPKGRSAAIELAEARRNWQGRFRTVPSVTNAQAVIVVAEQVEPRDRARDGAKR